MTAMIGRGTGAIFVGLCLSLSGLFWISSCSRNETPDDERLQRALFIEIDQSVIVPTSVVRITLRGTERVEEGSVRLSLTGDFGGRGVDETFSLQSAREGDVGNLFLELDSQELLWPRISPGAGGLFQGKMTVRLEDSLGIEALGERDGLRWRFVRELAPSLEVQEVSSTLFTNGGISVQGDGILRPEEGQTWARVLGGALQTERGHRIELTGERLPVRWEGTRSSSSIRLAPEVMGVHPGELELQLQFENQFRDGTTIASFGEFDVQSRMETTFIATFSPNAASRGQVVRVEGRGFLENGESTGMLLRFEGTFHPDESGVGPLDLTGSRALERSPFAVVDDELLLQDIWYEVAGRQLEGLGARPGRFVGSITPLVFDSFGEIWGVGWQGEFRILPTKQIVYLKYLPAFAVALDRYGLLNVEREIRDRILEVVHRDYEGLNIRFVEEKPENFVDFTTVELGGPDPADGYSFGYDNTYNDQPKDTGNLYIDNYLGGINWRAGQEWANPFGGIFVESFAFFSPTLHPENPFSSDHFDRVFGPFMPELNGRRVRATEWPGGERRAQIEEAIRVFGNVVGNTLSHEVGHVLGLAHFPDDWNAPGHIYHNLEASGCIMDAGSDRPFEQRAEIGQGPAVFNERNRTYLEQILPRPN